MSNNLTYKLTNFPNAQLQNCVVERKLQDNEIFARDTLNGEILFLEDEYDDLKALLATASKSQETLEVILNGVSTDMCYPLLNLLGNYDEDKKVCKLQASMNDAYQLLIDGYNDDVNIMDVVSKYSLNITTIGVRYTRTRKFEEVVKFIVNTLDPSIKFDSSPTSFNSFNYFISFTKGSYRPLANLFLDSMSNAILLDSGAEKTNEASICNFSLKRLTDYLKINYKIYWKIDTRIDGNYFRFIHYSEILRSVAIDLTNYLGIDWTANKSEFKFIQKDKFSRIKRVNTAGNIDFLGSDMIFPNLTGIFPEVNEINQTDVFTDVLDMFYTKSRYPGDSLNQIALYACDNPVLGSNLITGVITGGTFDVLTYIGTDLVCENIGVPNAFTTNFILTTGNPTLLISFFFEQTVGTEAPNISFFTGGVSGKTILFDIKEGLNEFAITEPLNVGGGTPAFLAIYDIEPFAHFTMDDFTIKTHSLIVLRNTGELSGSSNIDNVDLSQANLDNDHGKYNLPDSYVIVNGVATTGTKEADREQVVINVPIFKQNSIDFNNLAKTNLADLQPTSLKIFLNEQMAELTGKY